MSTRRGHRLDVVPDFLTAHQPEPDLKIWVAQLEAVGHLSEFLGVGIVALFDATVIRAAGNPEGRIDRLGVDISVEKIVEQRFELSAVLIGAWHALHDKANHPRPGGVARSTGH